MRLHRLVLRNWRGVDDRETHFAASGVTVVEGPNESGKSSLFQALDALLTHLDDSKKREVAAFKPVHKDVGSEVEAEIETGPYRFTYRKRFHRKPETTLLVTQPAPENLSGREAHDRVRQILDETLDADLWKALRIEQGQGVAQAELAKAKSLAAALDRAAGIARTGDEEETLHAAARQEYERYFTPASGAARKETAEAEAAVARLQAELAAGRAELAKLDQDIERSATLERERLEARGAFEQSAKQAVLYSDTLREIERMGTAVDGAKATLDTAERDAQRAIVDHGARVKLIDAARDTAAAYQALSAQNDLTLPALDDARAEHEAKESAFASARDATEKAERTHDVARQDFEFRRDELDLQQLGERKARVDKAFELAARAGVVLSQNAVSTEALRTLQEVHLEHEKAKAAFTAGSPELHLRALAELTPEIDGVARRVARGEALTLPVSGSTSVVFPGVVELEIRTGSSTAELRDARVDAERDYAAACRAAGVDSLGAAVAAHSAWRSAHSDIEARDEKLKDNLRDLTREELERKVAGLVLRVGGYTAARSAPFPIAPSFDAARELRDKAQATLDAARTARTDAERQRSAAHELLEQLREKRRGDDLARERAKTEAAMAEAALGEARLRASDDRIVDDVASTKLSAAAAETAHRELAGELAAAQPAQARLLAENAVAVRERAERRMRELDDEHIAVRARLKERGEEGLAERIDATASKLERAEDDLARRQVHAAAAKLLFTTLDAARNESRRAYVAPLRNKIEELGRLVHGAGLSVELNDDLQITQRTLDGRTLPFDSLSGGAQEQLGVIARVACAMLVAADGGVPVLFDDALGYSDPSRLEKLCALLSFAGRHCQVIVLTCVPERYRHVGGATVVRA